MRESPLATATALRGYGYRAKKGVQQNVVNERYYGSFAPDAAGALSKALRCASTRCGSQIFAIVTGSGAPTMLPAFNQYQKKRSIFNSS